MDINFNNVCSGYMRTEQISSKGVQGYNNVENVSKPMQKKDTVTISPEASAFRELSSSNKAIAAGINNFASQEKINSLKAQIAAGTYNVSADKVADAILERMVF